jgi:PPOX class probable F420-dependent enzyme
VDEQAARARFAAARVATLATVDSTGAPHLVPVVFAVEGPTVWSATDGKPKRANALRRHANIRARPAVSLLAHHWDERWDELWWVRADGEARIVTDGSTVQRVLVLLRGKYPQYATVPVGPPLIEVTVRAWHGWTAAPAPPPGPHSPTRA